MDSRSPDQFLRELDCGRDHRPENDRESVAGRDGRGVGPIPPTCTRSTASGAGVVAEAAEAVDEIANGLLALGIAKGRVVRAARPDEPRVGALRLRARAVGAVGAPIYSSSSERDVQYVLEHSQARRRPRRERRAARRRSATRCSPTSSRTPGSTSCARAVVRTRPRIRTRCRASRLDRRGRPVHVHLHVGDDRAAEGLHDPAPQLLRDGAEGRRDRASG